MSLPTHENMDVLDSVTSEMLSGIDNYHACYLKKKMTQSEFREWADYALDLRDKAYKGELVIEKHMELIKI